MGSVSVGCWCEAVGGGAALGEPRWMFAACRAHWPPTCLVVSWLQGGRRAERRLNNFFHTVVTLHNLSLSSFPGHLQDWRRVGLLLLEGQSGLWTVFVIATFS